MAIQTVIFDLGKVIVDFSFDEAYQRMEVLSGLSFQEQRDRLRAGNLFIDFEKGLLTPDEFLAEVNRRMGTSLDLPTFAELWGSIFYRSPLIPESIFAQISQRYQLLLLSNTNLLHFETIRENFPHIGHFHRLVLSYEVGEMKPDQAIYKAAIAQAGCPPSECLFFDDLAPNVEGARVAGLNSEQFTGMEKLQGDLARFGIQLV